MKFILDSDDVNEKVVGIKLEVDNDGVVSIIAVETSGEEWYLLELKDGKFERIEHVNAEFGVDVDSLGRIKEIK